jgi:alanine racemase
MLAQLTIDLDAVRANVATLRALVAPARIAAVVKANAYGHGLTPIAQTLAPDVDRLCVYEVSEGLALRAAGLSGRIHVLGPIAPADLGLSHEARLEVTLWDDGAYAADLRRVAERRGAPFAVHAKIDTGVTRLGVAAAAAPHVLRRYAAEPQIDLVGAFSHLAAAEELDSSFTSDQLAAFERATRGLDPAIERHIAASAAAMLWPQTRLGAIRPGIAVYGIWPSKPTAAIMRERGLRLDPALRWETQVVVIHAVPAHTPVGYGCTYHTTRPSRIGVLPIGYAEGLPRSSSNRGFVLVGGRRRPRCDPDQLRDDRRRRWHRTHRRQRSGRLGRDDRLRVGDAHPGPCPAALHLVGQTGSARAGRATGTIPNLTRRGAGPHTRDRGRRADR